MKLLESYSLYTGLKIGKPFLYEKFYPIPVERYITLQNTSGMPAKNYDFWQEVVDIIYPELQKIDIHIVQLGDQNTQLLSNTINLAGQTSIHQSAYIVSRALGHAGNDSWIAHYAGAKDVPVVEVFGPTSTKNHSPYIFNKEKSFFVESSRNGNKPSFSNQEEPKTINFVKPEEIAVAIFKMLDIESTVSKKSIYFGRNYNSPSVDLIPDCVLSEDFLKDIVPSIRMDLIFNEDYLAKNLAKKPYQIVTDRPVNEKILGTFRQHIKNVAYEIKDSPSYSVEFVKNLRKLGIPFILFSFLENSDGLNQTKLDFMDLGVIHKAEKKGKDFLNLELFPEINKDTSYKSSKFLLSDGKIYLSKLRWKEGKNVKSFQDNEDTVSLKEEFFDDTDSVYLFNK